MKRALFHARAHITPTVLPTQERVTQCPLLDVYISSSCTPDFFFFFKAKDNTAKAACHYTV